MDVGLIVGIAMLVIWVLGALVFDAPGWIHLFLTLCVVTRCGERLVQVDLQTPGAAVRRDAWA